jgi:quercetin dioxygenase-like cupin family protein
MPATIRITHAAEAETRWVVRDRIRFMGEVEGTELHVVEVEVPPSSGTPPHVHASPEIFRVLEGEITFGLFEGGPPRHVIAGAGTVVTVPSRVPHNYQNSGGVPARMLVVLERSMAEFFRAVGRVETPPAGPPSAEEIAAVIAACARHGITLLPPPTN